MCRLTLQVLGMLGNVHGRPRHALQHPRHAYNVLGMLTTSLADLGMLLQGPRSPTSKRNLPTCCLISYESKGVVYHQVSIYGSLVVHYSLGFTAYKAASGGVSLRCGTPRTLQKHADVVQGRCKACWGRPKTLPSMPKTLQSVLTHLRYPQESYELI